MYTIRAKTFFSCVALKGKSRNNVEIETLNYYRPEDPSCQTHDCGFSVTAS